jgi:autotransporter translocation and assembly factor TamB
MRYLRRAISIIALIILFCLFGLLILTRTPLVNEFLRNQVIAFAAANYRGTLKIGRIEGSIWGSLRLTQVALLYEGKTITSIAQVSLDYSLVPLLWRTVNLRITVDSPQIDASRQPNGEWNLAEALSPRAPAAPASAQRALTIDIDSVLVNNAALQIMPAGGGGPKYQVTNLNLDTGVRLPASGMAVNLRRLTATIAAPKMPPVYTSVALEYNALVSPPTVQLTDLDLRTQRSTISITGEARLAPTRSVDLKLSLRRLAAADVAQIYPATPLKSDLAGTITLQGPESSLHSVIALNSGGAALDGTAEADVTQKAPSYAVRFRLSNADLQKIIQTNDVAGVFDATVDTKGAGSDIGAITANLHLRGRNLKAKQYELGTLELAANAAKKKAGLVFTLAAPAGYLNARATTGIAANPSYHFELAAQHLNVTKAGIAANSPQTNLNLALLIDGHGLTPAAADTGIKIRVDRSQVGQISIDRGLLDARLANYRVDIARLHFEAAHSMLDVKGSAGLAANALSNISYAVRSPDIKELLALAKMTGSGSLRINGNLGGPRSGLRTRGTIEFSSLQTGGYSLQHGTSAYSVALTGPGAPSGMLDATMNGVKAGAELRTIAIMLEAPPGLPHAVALRLKVIDNAGREDLVSTHLSYQPPLISGQLTQMNLGLPGGDWHLIAPVDYNRSPRGVSISRLQLQSGSRELVLHGTIARQGAQDFNLVLNRFDLAVLQPLSPRLHEVHGMLSTKLEIAGTAEAPTISFAAQAAGLGIGKQPIGDLRATMNYGTERAAFGGVLQQNAADQLTATGSLPMSLSWNQGVKAKIGNAIDLTVESARLSLAQLGSLFPDQVRNVQGAAAVHLRVQGTLKQPQPAGSIRITGVGGQIVPLGVTISDAQLIVGLDARAVHIETIEAHAGGGTISGNGVIGLEQYVPSALGVALTFKQWPAINTEQYAAMIGGHLAADGTLSRPRLRGQLEVLSATIQPDIGFLSATSNLAPDETIDVIQPGERIPQPINDTAAAPRGRRSSLAMVRPEPSTFNNLAMKVGVIIHRNTWIRHPDAAAELEGNLDVDKDPGGPVRVAGEVRTVRGWMNYSNRQFKLKTGVFTFTGGPKIDPELAIDAQYPVTNYTIDLLVGGKASKPTLQLKSQPELAQADILSLILFGKTTDALGQSQRAGLQQQATKMATGAAAQQIGQAVTSSMGLQGTGIALNDVSSSGPSVGFSHYLGENTYVSASQPIGGSGGQRLSVQYFILRWLSITTTSASDGSHEIDLNLVKQY